MLEGRVGGSEQFRSTEHADVEEPETRPVLVLRIDESLYFGNARFVQAPCKCSGKSRAPGICSWT